jgi:transposase-like protein
MSQNNYLPRDVNHVDMGSPAHTRPVVDSARSRATIASRGSPPPGGSAMPKKKSGRGKRYTAAEKSRILKAALAQRLTAVQVQKKFGVSPITFYRWRGPVRGARRGRPAAAVGGLVAGLSDLRDQVRAGVQKILPSVIRQEVRAYLDRALAAGRRGRRPGRPRKRK